jgi:hypothetical protein
MNANIKKKVGRPVKKEEEYAVRVSTTTTPELKKKMDTSGYSVSYILQYGAKILLGDNHQKELIEIENELSILKPKLAMLESRRDLILAEQRRKEEYIKQRENEIKYLHAVFSQLIKLQEKSGKLSYYENWIKEQYGIQFNMKLVNENFQDALTAIDLLPEYVVEKYSIRKVQKGQREEKMMVELMDREDEINE